MLLILMLCTTIRCAAAQRIVVTEFHHSSAGEGEILQVGTEAQLQGLQRHVSETLSQASMSMQTMFVYMRLKTDNHEAHTRLRCAAYKTHIKHFK